MKKYPALLLMVVIVSLLISACQETPAPVPTVASSPTPTSKPTTTTLTEQPTASATSAEINYFQRLKRFNIGYQTYLLDIRLSPNGQWVVKAPSPFVLGQDYFEFASLGDDPVTIQVPVDNDFLGLPSDKIPQGEVSSLNLRSYGNNSSDHITWSPDSTIYLALGPAYQGSPFTFLVMFDISDPENVKKTLIQWDYPGEPYTAWSPDSSQYLIWFGEEVEMGKMFTHIVYADVAWLVDREGNILTEFDVSGYRTPTWVNDQIFVLKGENEIWRLDPLEGRAEKWYTSDRPIEKILDLNAENTQLLMFESTAPYDFLILDIAARQVIAEVPSPLTEYDLGDNTSAVSSTSHYTGIFDGHFYIFNWNTYTTSSYGVCFCPFWSSVLNGFVIEKVGTLDVIYP